MDAPINPPDPFVFGRTPSDNARPGGQTPPGNAPDRSHSARLSAGANAGDPFDALADLFLGPARAPEATSPPPLRLVSNNPPTENRAAPAPAQDGPIAGLDRLIEPKAEAMRSPRASHDPGAPTRVEGLVLGHLPVFASAWATQYAKHTAQVTGQTVALLRFTSGRASLDVYGPGATGQRCADLKGAIDAAAASSPRWMVRLPDACEPEFAEGGIDVLTLLSGADEAAVVSCYRTLKSLSGVDRSADAAPLTWRVAIMGSDPLKATDAARRVERAASAFLDSELEIAPCVARIGSLRSALLHDGPTDISWRDAIELVRIAMAAPHDPAPPPGSDLGSHSGFHPGNPHASTRANPVDRSAAPDTPPGTPRVEIRPIVSDPGAVAPRKAAPMRGPLGAAQSAPPLPERIEPPGWPPTLLRSPVRCPHETGVEFGVDADGRVHLLVRDGAEASIRSLVTASAWATAHGSLLSMADPRITTCQAPALHVVTTAPATDRRLLDTPVRVHALARVGTSWALLDLN